MKNENLLNCVFRLPADVYEDVLRICLKTKLDVNEFITWAIGQGLREAKAEIKNQTTRERYAKSNYRKANRKKKGTTRKSHKGNLKSKNIRTNA